MLITLFLALEILKQNFISNHLVALFRETKNLTMCAIFNLFRNTISRFTVEFGQIWYLTFYDSAPILVVVFLKCKMIIRCILIDFVETVFATMSLRWPNVVLKAIPCFGGVNKTTVLRGYATLIWHFTGEIYWKLRKTENAYL